MTGKRIYLRNFQNGGVVSITFSPKGRLLAVGFNTGKIYFFEVGSWQGLRSINHYFASELEITRDEKYICSSVNPLKNFEFRHLPRSFRIADISSGKIIMESTKTTDVFAIALGKHQFPYCAFSDTIETIICIPGVNDVIASFNQKFEILKAHPNGRSWVGINNNRIYSIVMEGISYE